MPNEEAKNTIGNINGKWAPLFKVAQILTPIVFTMVLILAGATIDLMIWRAETIGNRYKVEQARDDWQMHRAEHLKLAGDLVASIDSLRSDVHRLHIEMADRPKFSQVPPDIVNMRLKGVEEGNLRLEVKVDSISEDVAIIKVQLLDHPAEP